MSCETGEINLVELLTNEIAALYMSEQCSDITLYVEGQKIPAHRSIIGARCEYLKTYFSNSLNEPNQTKFELDVPLEAFQVLLKYFYTGQMSLKKIKNLETLIQILNLIEEYCLFYLKTHLENYFKQLISVENTCRLLEVAKMYQLKELEIKSQRIGQLPEQNENVALPKYNTRTLQGDFQYADHIKYKHAIGDGSSIIIELGQIFIINHLKMELLGLGYGYFIKTSTDQTKWEYIINYSSYICTSMQNLYFPSKPVKYVKIVGTWPLEKNLVVGTIEAYYRENIPEIRNGIVIPNEAVEYYLYWKGTRCIISFDQPYYISSMRFYIDNGNSNGKYKFYIETSLNEEDWVKVANQSDKYVNGWQTFRFTLKKILNIRITPTACSDGPVNFFNVRDIIKNFECPSSV